MSDKPENTNATRWAPFIAHELLHLWSGGAIKYAEQEYWFSEGFTDYYANVICARSGLISEQDSIERLRRASESYLKNCGVTSIRQAGDAGSHNSALQYGGGSLVAAVLDIRIRRLTNNAKSLDDLMRQMYKEFGKTGERYTIEDVVRIAGGVTGTEHSDFFDKYVLGTDELPLEEYFGYIGLDLEKEIGEVLPSRNYVIHGLLGIQSLTRTPEGLIIRRSQDAGYRDEDNLVAIDGEPVKTFRDLQVMAKEFSPGDKVEPSLLRGGKRITMELALGGEGKEPSIEREVEVSIGKKTRLDSSQEALLSAILGGM
jgi:predicted metalloprotease with PDZ domain